MKAPSADCTRTSAYAGTLHSESLAEQLRGSTSADPNSLKRGRQSFSSIVGFESPLLTSSGLNLGQCLSGTKALNFGLGPPINTLIDANGFVSNLGNYACCRDFNEANCNAISTSTNNACADNAAVNLPTNACAF